MTVDRAVDLSSLRYMLAVRLLTIRRHLEPELGADFVLWNRLSQALDDAKPALNPAKRIAFRDWNAPDATRKLLSIDARTRYSAYRIPICLTGFEGKNLGVKGSQSQLFEAIAIRVSPAELCAKFAGGWAVL